MLKINICIVLCLLNLFVLHAQNYNFTWEGATSGMQAVWTGTQALETYYVPQHDMNIKVSITDPFLQNTTPTNLSDYGDYTRTNTFYGSGNLAFQVKSVTSGQAVCLKFEFDKPVVLKNFKIYDIDMKQDGGFDYNTYQDSVMLVARRNNDNVGLLINHMSAQPKYAITGQAVKAVFEASVNGDLPHNDPRGAINVSSSGPITELAVYYSNGSEDDGLSNSHAIKITDFEYELFQSPLPVKITDLHLHQTNAGQFDVEWKAISEVNNDYYTVLLSADGKKFMPVGEVKGQNKDNHKYNFSLGKVDHGRFYVKLMQHDYDGTNNTIGIVEGTQKVRKATIKLLGTIVSDQLRMVVSESQSDHIKWEIFDMNGRSISIGYVSPGESNIDIQSLAAGTYTIKAGTDSYYETLRFVKM